jgi:HEAT repeat protein
MYNVRMREIVRLQEQGAQREAELYQQIEMLKKKNIRLEAEKATAQISCTKTQGLLGEYYYFHVFSSLFISTS